MCEFQYLPVARKEDGSYENLLEDVVMRKLTPMSDYINRKLPLFIPPVIFSRFDIPQGYGYMKGRTSRTKFNTSVEPAGSVAVGMFVCLSVCLCVCLYVCIALSSIACFFSCVTLSGHWVRGSGTDNFGVPVVVDAQRSQLSSHR